MDDSESPTSTSPVEPSNHSQRSTRSKRHHRHDGKDRDRSSIVSSSKELAKVIVRQESEVKDLRNRLYIMSERLKDETQRADDAEKKVMEAVIKFKEANEARLVAQQHSQRLEEELRLYQMQLDVAQKEILRAQTLLDSLEAARNDAEEAAARARTTARKLKEEKIVLLAREEGRKQGYKEGLAQARATAYEEDRSASYSRTRPSPRRELPVDEPIYVIDPSPPRDPSGSSSTSSSSSRPIEPTPLFQGSPPEDIHIRRSPAPSGPLNMKDTEIHPVMVHSVQVDSPSHAPIEYPPDGWVPEMDKDGRVRLPPPHELAPSLSRPITPAASPSASATLNIAEDVDQPAKFIPPPFQTPRNASGTTLSDIEARTNTPAVPKRPLHRRRNSEESQSTTMSQFEILGPPPSAHRHIERPNVLSAIVEEKERSSTISSPQNPGSSPYHNPSTPQPIHGGLLATPSQYENTYTRPRSHSSLSDAGNLNLNTQISPPSRSQSKSRPSPKGSMSSDVGININVEPPSRPTSNDSGASGTQHEPYLLSATDAENIPPAVPAMTDPAPPPSTGQATPGLAPLTGFTSMPVELPPDGDLPPGFMPMGPIGSHSVAPGQPYTNPMTPAAVPLPPSTATSMYPLRTPVYGNPVTPAQVPLPPSAATSLHPLNTPSALGSTGFPGGYTSGQAVGSTDPVVIPLPSSSIGGRSNSQSGRYSRAALHQESSSDDPISSSLSDSDSMDSLTTPPQRYRKTPGPTYATAPTPPDVTYPLPVVPPTPGGSRSNVSLGSRGGSVRTAAKVPLPASTIAASPRSTVTRLSKKAGSTSGSVRA